MQILVLVRNQAYREMIKQSLVNCGHDVITASTVKGAFDLLKAATFPVVISDVEHETLVHEPFSTLVARQYPETQVIISTTNLTTLNEAVTTLRKGDYSFLVKTFEDAGLISATLNRAIDNVRVLTDLRTRLEDLQKKSLELSGLNKTLQNLEVRDALTGLHGQLHFQEALGKELIRSVHNTSSFSLLLMEVRLLAGGGAEEQPLADGMIAQLAKALRGSLRRCDLIALYREQTFGLLLPETPKDASQYVIRNIVELLERFPFTTAKPNGPSTVIAYFGLSGFPVDGSSISSLSLEAEAELKLSNDSGGISIDQHAVINQAPGTPPIDVSNDDEQLRRRVLVVDDEPTTCSMVEMVLTDNGYEVSIAENGEDALKLFQDKPYPVVISDVIMPGMSGLELLKKIKVIQPETEVVIMTSQNTLAASINAMRAGAFDFLPKPLEDMDIIPITTDRAFDNFDKITEKHLLIAELEKTNKSMVMSNKALQELVIRDGLTGLYNHNYFKEAVEIEMVRSKRYRRQFAVLFMDLDHFKHYNDTHGHPAGDQLLKTLAILVRDQLRESDILARYGGEEFTAILPEIAKGDAVQVADKIRREVENYPFPGHESQPGGKVGITIGVAAFSEDGETPEVLINNADQALYRGKTQGRNCVST